MEMAIEKRVGRGGGHPSDACATLEDGIQAVLIGAAANLSITEGRAVTVQTLTD